MLIELCVDSVDSAVAAESGGAGRVELCTALLEGGLTPSAGMIGETRRRLQIPVHVMIRPRGGDFLYSAAEFDVLRRDIDTAGTLGAAGVVLGVLTQDGDVDERRTRALIEQARPLSVTFHRAFDMTRDPRAALETLAGLGVNRILTSGQEATALEGLDLIVELVGLAAGRLIVLPGGGIHDRNVRTIVSRARVDEVHVALARPVEGGMVHRNTRCFMGGELRPPEYSLAVTDPADVRTFVQTARDGRK